MISWLHLSDGVASNPLDQEDKALLSKKAEHKDIDLLPPEKLNEVFKFLPLTDMLRITLVSKKWAQIAREGAFKDFQAFMDKYKECSAFLANPKNISFEESCHVLITLRCAQKNLEQGGRSKDEIMKIAQNYVLTSPKIWTVNIQDKIIYLATWRVYLCAYQLGIDQQLGLTRERKSWHCYRFEIFAPIDVLENAFIGEQDVPYKCAIASELCERPGFDLQILINEANSTFLQENYAIAAKLYSIALEKDPTLKAAYYANAGKAYIHMQEWKKAAHHYSIALEKDPNLPAFNYVDAGYVFEKLGNEKTASGYFQTFINLLGDEPMSLFPDTLEIMENVLRATNANKRYLEWVSTRRG